jgi:hypothetical protein
LFSPASLSFNYEDGKLGLRARYLFLSFDLLKQRPEKPQKPEKPKQKEKKAKEKKPEEKREPGETAALVYELILASRHALNILRRHLIFYKIKVTAVVGGPDAHKTGDRYAAFCVVIPNVLSLLDSIFSAKEPQLLIMPNFMSEKTYWRVAFKVRIAPAHVLSAALFMLARFIKAVLSSRQKRKKAKGGKKHEPTISRK